MSPCYENILDLSRNTFRGSSPEPPPSPLQVPTYPQLTLEVPRVPEVLRSPGIPSSPCHPESCPYEGTQEKSSDKAGSESPILAAGPQAAHPRSLARGQDGDLEILATRLCETDWQPWGN